MLRNQPVDGVNETVPPRWVQIIIGSAVTDPVKFDANEDREVCPNSLYIYNCKTLLEKVPEDWDGSNSRLRVCTFGKLYYLLAKS